MKIRRSNENSFNDPCFLLSCVQVLFGMDARLLLGEMMRTESREQYVKRLGAEAVALKEFKSVMPEHLLFPYGPKNLSVDSFRSMSVSEHCNLASVEYRIEQAVNLEWVLWQIASGAMYLWSIHLFCLIGNDFSNGFEIASPSHRIRKYFVNKDVTGSLKSEGNVLILFYAAVAGSED